MTEPKDPKEPDLDDEADEADEADEDLRETKPRPVARPNIFSDKSEDEIKEDLDRRTFVDDDQNTEGDTSNH